MPVIRDPPLAASLLLVALALFLGGGSGDGSLWWLGAGAATAAVALAALQGVPEGGSRSLRWLRSPRGQRSRSRGRGSRRARGTTRTGRSSTCSSPCSGSGSRAARGRSRLGCASLLGAVALWALLGKVLPPVYDYGPPGVARLRGPVGLWNQLALLGDFALPLALWRKRLSGTLLAFCWLVALVLTYSRGGLATAALVVAAFLVLTDDRWESGATLVAAAVPAAAVVGIAFALPGVTSDGQSNATRWRDGLIFGAVLLAGAGAAALLARARRPRDTPALRRGLVVVGALALAGVVTVAVVKAGSFDSGSSVGNGAGRFGSGSSNFRTVWWQQAWDGWQGQKLTGTGGGTFHLTNLRFRDSFLDETTEPHSLPLQFLTETGVVGFVLFLAACALPAARVVAEALARARAGARLPGVPDPLADRRRLGLRRRLGAGVPRCGCARRPRAVPPCLAVRHARGGRRRRTRDRRARAALARQPLGDRRARRLARTRRDAREPRRVRRPAARRAALGQGVRSLDDPATRIRLYREAVRRQPKNPQTWLLAGRFAFEQRCYQTAYTYLEKYTELDNKAKPSAGGDDYNAALEKVNAGKGRC